MTRPTIVTFVSETYIPVGQNWLKALMALDTGANVVIVALDQATRDAFPAHIVRYQPREATDLGALWLLRIKVLRELLEEGNDIIHSDADAVWVKNPLPMLMECGTEIVFSQGTIWPTDVHERHGIVLCCGFFYLKNTLSVRGFMQKVETRVEQDKDDQISFNRLFNESGIKWIIKDPYQIPFRDTTFVASPAIISSEVTDAPSVAILPHHMFPRIIDQMTPDVIVAHPLSGKTCENKVTSLSQLGLWN